ncbi:hypothetical protein E2C01_046143 [Portunus trituberculatus]|uniref:Uncharacterized protein n=1 Tax=Portunus trituberculatus TaxID=210409 RepID=A0A5B7G405_PORTR|nr:hypothetical protein [Portunus trituberculatus]
MTQCLSSVRERGTLRWREVAKNLNSWTPERCGQLQGLLSLVSALCTRQQIKLGSIGLPGYLTVLLGRLARLEAGERPRTPRHIWLVPNCLTPYVSHLIPQCLQILLQLALHRLQVILHCLQFTLHTFAGKIGVILRLRPQGAQARLQHHQLLCVFRLLPCLF